MTAAVQVEIAPSKVQPGDETFCISGPTLDAVQNALFDLEDTYSTIHATLPQASAAGGYVVYGRARK